MHAQEEGASRLAMDRLGEDTRGWHARTAKVLKLTIDMCSNLIGLIECAEMEPMREHKVKQREFPFLDFSSFAQRRFEVVGVNLVRIYASASMHQKLLVLSEDIRCR